MCTWPFVVCSGVNDVNTEKTESPWIVECFPAQSVSTLNVVEIGREKGELCFWIFVYCLFGFDFQRKFLVKTTRQTVAVKLVNTIRLVMW